jgi:CO/xanthine dehydrogenase FAD-binding subunit
VTLVHYAATAAQAGAGPFVAGSTALQLSWGDSEPAALTDITALAEAQGVDWNGARLRIGALETLERCRTDPLILQHAPILTQACTVIAALGVRTLGTLGGNIGWRQGDTVPALLALGALVETTGGLVPLDDLLEQDPLPLMLAVHLHRPPPVAVFEKIGHRAAFSPSAVTVAGSLDRRRGMARLAAGGAGHAARRLPRSEALLARTLPARAVLEAAIASEVPWCPTPAGRVLAGLLFEALAA